MLWNLKYLPKFKWRNLTDQLAFERTEREYRLRNEMAQARSEANEFINKIEKSKMVKGMEYKKSRKLASEPSSSAASQKTQPNTFSIKQHDTIFSRDSTSISSKKVDASVSSVLGKLL
ncbi:Pre-rRNA-processing protein esf2 [Smittium culicis]|uniref:Pre-rRNA-processing protein esf2 n=1 Tax=Smittium culicis TaxID=133412 RepID=A0A1R1XPK6_9FUNG|nr:Pre-rRNA-processing protein esf2 [Smittium culicis]